MEPRNSVEAQLGYLTGIVEKLTETIKEDRAQVLQEIKEIKEVFKEHDTSDDAAFIKIGEWQRSVDKKLFIQKGYIAGATAVSIVVIGLAEFYFNYLVK